jgi:polar amino acid transport system substrate-binding protein
MGQNRIARNFPAEILLNFAGRKLACRKLAARSYNPGGDAMLPKRLVQVAIAAATVAALAFAAMPASAQQVLKVGSTPTGIPFTFLDTKTNSIQGIMVDLITEVGKDAGFKVEIEPMQFSALVASLTSNKIDIISAAMFITASRKEVIDFSDPFYTYGEGLLVPKTDTKDYTKQDDLKGEVVGAQVGTAFVDALKKSGLFAEVKAYDTIPDILRDVNAGRLKAGFGDYPILAYNLKQGGFPEVRIVETYKPSVVGSVGIGVRKGDTELLAKINASLAKLKANGTTDKILDKWGLKAQGG